MKWCGPKPKLTAEQVAEVRRIAEMKQRAKTLPTWAALGQQWGVAPETVRNAAKPETFKRYRQILGGSTCT